MDDDGSAGRRYRTASKGCGLVGWWGDAVYLFSEMVNARDLRNRPSPARHAGEASLVSTLKPTQFRVPGSLLAGAL